MKGYIRKNKDEWIVKYKKSYKLDKDEAQYEGKSIIFYDEEIPLHPDDVNQIFEDSKVFDNIEARIKCYPEVEFEIVTQQKISGIVTYAKLK